MVQEHFDQYVHQGVVDQEHDASPEKTRRIMSQRVDEWKEDEEARTSARTENYAVIKGIVCKGNYTVVGHGEWTGSMKAGGHWNVNNNIESFIVDGLSGGKVVDDDVRNELIQILLHQKKISTDGSGETVFADICEAVVQIDQTGLFQHHIDFACRVQPAFNLVKWAIITLSDAQSVYLGTVPWEIVCHWNEGIDVDLELPGNQSRSVKLRRKLRVNLNYQFPIPIVSLDGRNANLDRGEIIILPVSTVEITNTTGVSGLFINFVRRSGYKMQMNDVHAVWKSSSDKDDRYRIFVGNSTPVNQRRMAIRMKRKSKETKDKGAARSPIRSMGSIEQSPTNTEATRAETEL